MAGNANRLGLLLALLMGGFHALWALLVAIGAAQPLLNFILWAHFLSPVWRVESFEPVRAAVLIGFTAAVGYVAGFAASLIWSRMRRA